MESEDESQVVDLNVGGYMYSTTWKTIKSETDNFLVDIIKSNSNSKDTNKRIFIDRDGKLFRFILEYLRNNSIILPDNFKEKASLRREAKYFRLTNMINLLDSEDEITALKISTPSSTLSNFKLNQVKSNSAGCITIGYRGTFSNGRDGMSDVKFNRVCILP